MSKYHLGYLFLDKVDALPSMEKVAKALDKVTFLMRLFISKVFNSIGADASDGDEGKHIIVGWGLCEEDVKRETEVEEAQKEGTYTEFISEVISIISQEPVGFLKPVKPFDSRNYPIEYHRNLPHTAPGP